MFSLTQAVLGGDPPPSEATDDNDDDESSTPAPAAGIWGAASAAWGQATAAVQTLNEGTAFSTETEAKGENEEVYGKLESSIEQAETAVTSAVLSAWGSLSAATPSNLLGSLDTLQQGGVPPEKQRILESLDIYLAEHPEDANYEQWVEYYLKKYESSWDEHESPTNNKESNKHSLDPKFYDQDSLHRNVWNERNYHDGIPTDAQSLQSRHYIPAWSSSPSKSSISKGNTVKTADGALLDDKDEEIVFVTAPEDDEENDESEEAGKKQNDDAKENKEEEGPKEDDKKTSDEDETDGQKMEAPSPSKAEEENTEEAKQEEKKPVEKKPVEEQKPVEKKPVETTSLLEEVGGLFATITSPLGGAAHPELESKESDGLDDDLKDLLG